MITDEENVTVTDEDTIHDDAAITDETVAVAEVAPTPDRPVQGAGLEHLAEVPAPAEGTEATIEDKIMLAISKWVNEHVYNSELTRVSSVYNKLTALLPKLVDFVKKEIGE